MDGVVGSTASTSQWLERMSQVPVSKSSLNSLIMNYLVVEGFRDAATVFARESGQAPGCDLEAVENRMKVRSAISEGRVLAAMELVNDMNPETLDTHPKLYFHLYLQHLIELIREDKVEQALTFAQEEIAPLADENPQCLDELEEVLTLLAFQDRTKCPLKRLLDASQRQKTASELNSAILSSQGQDHTPRLPVLLRLLSWCRENMKQRSIPVPPEKELGLDLPAS